MADSRALVGPPFHFSGRFNESQKEAFVSWVKARKDASDDTQTFHQIRAHQLRKMAGALESFYAAETRKLKPSFQKDPWTPGDDGHFVPTVRMDYVPANTVGGIKAHFTHALKSDDRSVFRMNWLRTMIESEEDSAQKASDAPDTVDGLLQDLDRHFADPQYRANLVKDKSDLYKGEPRFRVHPLDPPTAYELELAAHSLPQQE